MTRMTRRIWRHRQGFRAFEVYPGALDRSLCSLFVLFVAPVKRIARALRLQAPFPLPTTDGWMLRTIGDAGAYILALPKKRKRLARWEQVSRLIVKEAGVASVTQQVHQALSKDNKLDVVAFESITSARRWPAVRRKGRRSEDDE